MDFRIEHFFHTSDLQDIFPIINKYVNFLNVRNELTSEEPNLYGYKIKISTYDIDCKYIITFDTITTNIILRLIISKLDTIRTQFDNFILRWIGYKPFNTPNDEKFHPLKFLLDTYNMYCGQKSISNEIVINLSCFDNNDEIVMNTLCLNNPKNPLMIIAQSFKLDEYDIRINKQMLTFTLDNFIQLC